MGQDRTGNFRVGRGVNDWVYVDVDGTLLLWPTDPGSPLPREVEAARRKAYGLNLAPGTEAYLPRVNTTLVNELLRWAAKRKGVVAIWSMGGAEHATLARKLCGLDNFSWVICLAKPDMMVDDGARHLMAKHPVVLPGDFKCPTQ